MRDHLANADCLVVGRSAGGVCVVITVGVHGSAVGSTVVAVGAIQRLSVSIVSSGVRGSNSGPGVASVVRWAVGTVLSGSKTTSCAKLSVLSCVLVGLFVLARKDVPSSSARGVVVLGRWAVALLLLVMTGKDELDGGADEEEKTIKKSVRI